MVNKVLSNEIINDSDVKRVAEQLVNAPIEKQKITIDNIYAQSAINAFKVGTELIKMIKKTDDEVIKSNKQFMDLCDKGTETLNKAIDNGEVSEDEKKDIRDKLFEILKMAHESNMTAMAMANDSKNKKIVASAIVGGTFAVLGILKLIATTMSKTIKK